MQDLTSQMTNDRANPTRLVKVLGYSIIVLICVVSAELACRLYWQSRIPGAFLDPSRIIYNYQSNLLKSGLPDADIRRDDGYFDVLLLGGSVVSRDFGRIDEYLQAGLSQGERHVRVWNAAEAAHSSRDSWEKYRLLGAKNFDLVIVYDGINESRFNNVEPSEFKADYSHVGWYQQINALQRHPEVGYFALPFTLEKMLIDAGQYFGLFAGRHAGASLPNASNRPTLTKGSFAHYIGLIVEAARRRGEPVVLVTNALYSPLSTDAWLGTRLWGVPEMIEQDVSVHNDVARRIAANAPNVVLVGMAGMIQSSRDYFTDACHLTDKGAHKWVEVFLAQLGKSELLASARQRSGPVTVH